MRYDKDEDRPMHATKADFGSLLKKGLGRAAIMLQDAPDDADLNAQLLRACTEDLAYDRQCEESRVPYLFQLIRLTGQAGTYRAALEGPLKAAKPADAEGNIAQAFGILCRLAAADGADQSLLRDFVLTTEDRKLAMACAWELVRLQGVDALLACADHFRPEIAAEPWLIASMAHELEERDGASAAASALEQARRADVEFDRLMGLADAETKRFRKPTAVPTYAGLKADVEQGTCKFFPRDWVIGASETEIGRVAKDLLAEADETRAMAYLTAFRSRAFPGDPTRLFPLLRSANRRVARRAADALALISHPAIRSFGLQLIAEGQPDLGTRLLRNSHGEGDLALVWTQLDRLAPDADAYHGVGLSALSLIKNMAKPQDDARVILLHLYENEPCSLCRGTAVDLLAAMNGVPDWMLKEGRYDAEPGIAERFAP
jgi:hypothetical protein